MVEEWNYPNEDSVGDRDAYDRFAAYITNIDSFKRATSHDCEAACQEIRLVDMIYALFINENDISDQQKEAFLKLRTSHLNQFLARGYDDLTVSYFVRDSSHLLSEDHLSILDDPEFSTDYLNIMKDAGLLFACPSYYSFDIHLILPDFH